jgi:predicted nucleic acid-binding protein
MNAVFADTSFFVALLVSRDRFHIPATRLMTTIVDRIITTDWVLVEMANFMSRSKTRRRVTSFIRELQADHRIDIVPATAAAIEAGLAQYEQYDDKEWSLTDCISFQIMRREGIQKALTADHHFEQAGFEILLK